MEHDHAAMLASMTKGMDHDMPGMPPGHQHPSPTPAPTPMCKMNMIWDWSYPQDVCVVFRSWQIRTTFDLYLYTGLVIIAAAAFEWLRLTIVAQDMALCSSAAPTRRGSASPDLPGPAAIGTGTPSRRSSLVKPLAIPRTTQLGRAALHGARVALSMWLMLVFMTYNAYLAASVVIGAILGHYLFDRDIFRRKASVLRPEDSDICH